MKFVTLIAAVLAAGALAASPVSAATKMSRQYDKDGRYHFMCYLKDAKSEVCGNWKVFK